MLLYSGEQADRATGQQYLRERYDASSIGRFDRFDMLACVFDVPQSLHKYLYGHDDPVNGIDPSGREFGSVSAMAASSIGGTLNSITAELGNTIMNGLLELRLDCQYVQVTAAMAGLGLGPM